MEDVIKESKRWIDEVEKFSVEKTDENNKLKEIVDT